MKTSNDGPAGPYASPPGSAASPRTVVSALAALAAVVALASGCSLASTAGEKPGELGNGGFFFSCADAVSCAPYSNDAAKFPSAISLGSSFDVRFVPKSNTSGTNIRFSEGAPNRGITVSSVGEDYVSRGPAGFVALKSGYATLASRDASGQLVDYVVVRVAKPDTLLVYPADGTSSTPAPVSTVALANGERRPFRAFAQAQKQDLAGSLQIEWTSSNPSVVYVESVNDGTASVVARSAGKASLVATGGTFVQSVPVVVSP
jgi:hypothetical protein